MEMASVASNDGGARSRSLLPIHPPPQASFATSNMMGPPLTAAGPLCSALLLAANAACRPDSSIPFRSSFDASGDDKSAISDVVAHVDTVRELRLIFRFLFPYFFSGALVFAFRLTETTIFVAFSFTQDDCCDRSEVESEVSTLHSQDDMTSEHKEEILNDSVMSAGEAGCSNGSLLHHASEQSLTPPNGRGGHGGMFHVVFARPTLFLSLVFVQQYSSGICLYCSSSIYIENYNLQRFRHGHLPEVGTNHLKMPQDGTFNPWEQEYFNDRGREDDWSNR